MKQELAKESRTGWLYGAGCLLCLEVFIAAFMHDRFVRPYVGDLLAVVFLYCLVKSAAVVPSGPTILGVLLFAYAIEISQYFHLAAHLGMQHIRLALVVLGSHFSWVDMLMYTLGALLLAGGEWLLAQRLVAARL
ncbi:DUF2809 domain-containing protein [Hymenobacter sp. HMF4947]|uniref:DUF2809 domain-containing protein n=1 Tax=Hymenobacter ginkgonis TaxID=2682976 RepID=A0A7K1TK69_9BACT|nr:DUF2809 domain-containing protein [Hymenobacter ginkgonis]MVN78762.1 DUF2809 domain-containing protein [Hymenobacter ginkgonis]